MDPTPTGDDTVGTLALPATIRIHIAVKTLTHDHADLAPVQADVVFNGSTIATIATIDLDERGDAIRTGEHPREIFIDGQRATTRADEPLTCGPFTNTSNANIEQLTEALRILTRTLTTGHVTHDDTNELAAANITIHTALDETDTQIGRAARLLTNTQPTPEHLARALHRALFTR